MFHDYHLYTAPGIVREAKPDAFLHHFVHIPWPHPDAWRILPRVWRDEIFDGPALQRHHRLPHQLLRPQLPRLLPRAGRLRGRLPQRGRPLRRPRDLDPRLPARDRRRAPAPRRRHRRRRRLRARAARPPPRAPDHPRRPRRPLQERAARLHRLRPVPHRPPRVPREGHVHRPPAAVAAGRRRVPGVPRADRGARRGRQPPPRDHRLDADRPADLRELPRGRRPLQALRPADGQLALRRHEPGRQGGAGGQHPRRAS